MTSDAALVRGPYRKGIERRAQIVQSASEVFAALGYTGGSLRAIADRVGSSSATLIQLFGSKEGLLNAVLEDWTRQTYMATLADADGLDFFRAMRGLMPFHVEHRGLLELFITLAAESSNPDHPAHPFIRQRYGAVYGEWSGHLRTARECGDVGPMTDEEIAREVHWLLAMADGLEIQWLINPDLDLVARFNSYLDDAIRRWQQTSSTT